LHSVSFAPHPRGTGHYNPMNRQLDGHDTWEGNTITFSNAQLCQYTNYYSSSYGPFTNGPAFSELSKNHYSHMVLIGHILKKDNSNYFMLQQGFFYILFPKMSHSNPNLVIVNIFKTFCKSILNWYVGYGKCQIKTYT
jgi:hypothetical protein